jgi:hypothetical protein
VWSSKKIHLDNIEVTWIRQIVKAGTVVETAKSSLGDGYSDPAKDYNSFMRVAASSDNGLANNLSSNLRIQNYVFPSTYNDATDVSVNWYIGHPTERVKPELGGASNYAARFTAITQPKQVYRVNIRTLGFLGANLGIHPSDISEILAVASNIWRQIGISFWTPPLAEVLYTKGAPNADGWDLPDDSSSYLSPVLHVDRDYGINVTIVHSMYGQPVGDKEGVLLLGATNVPGALTVYPGIVLAAFASKTDGTRRTNADLGKTLAHELMHYLLQQDNKLHDTVVDKQWRLAAGDGAALRLNLILQYRTDVLNTTSVAASDGSR